MSKRSRSVLGLALLAGLLCEPTFAARPEPVLNWVHPGLHQFVLPRIAILPAVPIEGGLDVCPFVEKRWLSSTTGPRMRWLPAVLARERLKSGGGDSLLRRVSLDVLRNGRVDSLTAPAAARALGVRGLLSARIDMWRHEEAGTEGRTRAVVALTCSLVDSTGVLLWAASDRNVYETTANLSELTAEFGQAPAEFDSALVGLVGKWAAIVSSVPASPPASKGP
jgi:hypothetical protein